MSIEQNVAARKCAQEVGKFIEWESGEFADAGAKRIYFEQLLHEVTSRCPEVIPKPIAPEVEPMKDAEAVAFGRRPIDFGKYVGTDIERVPLEYLAWLADGRVDPFKSEVHRYLLNPTVKLRHETEVSCDF